MNMSVATVRAVDASRVSRGVTGVRFDIMGSKSRGCPRDCFWGRVKSAVGGIEVTKGSRTEAPV
jgi:hypothetical protein